MLDHPSPGPTTAAHCVRHRPVKISLYLSSDRKDTDPTLTLVDVYADGKASNLNESIERARWREGWDKPVFMEAGHAYRVDVGSLVTSKVRRD